VTSTNALILQHQDDAPPGLVLEVLEAHGLPSQTVRLDRGEALPDPSTVTIAVTLGSDASADDRGRAWVRTELEWIAGADRAGTAVLGLCFGAQALAAALGGGVERATAPERGWVRVRTAEPALVGHGPWLAWHDDVIDLPGSAQLLAQNDSGPQAFRLGRHLGVQFHPEVTPQIVRDWVDSSRDGDATDAQKLLADTAREFPHAADRARTLFTGFISSVRRRS